MQTNTLAELYLRQGLVDKALEVYRAMLRLDPENARLQQRLRELDGGNGGTSVGRTAPVPPVARAIAPAPEAFDSFPAPAEGLAPFAAPSASFAAAPAPRTSVEPRAPAPAAFPESREPAVAAPAREDVARIERLRRFLRAVQTGRPGKAAPR